jgi:hypothetical protein
MGRIVLVQDRVHWKAFMKTAMNLGFYKRQKFLDQQSDYHFVRFHFITAATMKMTLLGRCTMHLVETGRLFRGSYFLVIRIMITLIMEAVSPFETSANFYYTTWLKIPVQFISCYHFVVKNSAP